MAQVIRNRKGQKVGEVRQIGTRQVVRDSKGKKLGDYDGRNTRDSKGRKVGQGNLLTSLLDED